MFNFLGFWATRFNVKYMRKSSVYVTNWGADVNVRNVNNDTALILAAWYGYTEIVQILLDAEADMKVINNAGDTALTVAIFNKHKEVESLLRNAGAKE